MFYRESSTEEDLLAGCRKNDRRAQKYLYKRFYSGMLAVCMRYTRDKEAALEILNDSFLKVFQGIETFEGKGALGAWIRSIVFHTSIDHVRKNTSYKNVIDLESTYESEVSEDVFDRLSAMEILEYLQNITPASRNVFSLYVIEGYMHKEIAEILHISTGTSKWHLANARKELQRLLIEKGNYLIAL